MSGTACAPPLPLALDRNGSSATVAVIDMGSCDFGTKVDVVSAMRVSEA